MQLRRGRTGVPDVKRRPLSPSPAARATHSGCSGSRSTPTAAAAVPIAGSEYVPLALFYVAYMVNIWTTSTFEVGLPLIADDPSVEVGTEDLSAGLALGQVATVGGKLVTGPLVSWRGAGRAFPEALCTMGIVLALGVAALRSEAPLVAMGCFMVLKVAKATVWTAMALATKLHFRPQILTRAWGILTTSSRAGALAGSWLLGPLAMRFGWPVPALVVACSLLAVAALLCLWGPSESASSDNPANRKDSGSNSSSEFGEVLGVLRRDKQLWLLFAVTALLIPIMDSSALLPLFLSQQLAISVADAARLASAFAAGMVVSTVGATMCFDSLGSWRKVVFLLMATGTGAVSFAALGTAATPSAAGLLLFLGGAGIAPAQYLVTPIYTMQTVDQRHAGTLMSMMDMSGYMISACVFKYYPVVVAWGGWGAFFAALGGMIAAATVCVCTQVALESQPAAEEANSKLKLKPSIKPKTV